jgi:hypothetical protein
MMTSTRASSCTQESEVMGAMRPLRPRSDIASSFDRTSLTKAGEAEALLPTGRDPQSEVRGRRPIEVSKYYLAFSLLSSCLQDFLLPAEEPR